MAEQVYTSRVRIERVRGPIRHAYIAPFAEPVRFGVHGAIKLALLRIDPLDVVREIELAEPRRRHSYFRHRDQASIATVTRVGTSRGQVLSVTP